MSDDVKCARCGHLKSLHSGPVRMCPFYSTFSASNDDWPRSPSPSAATWSTTEIAGRERAPGEKGQASGAADMAEGERPEFTLAELIKALSEHYDVVSRQANADLMWRDVAADLRRALNKSRSWPAEGERGPEPYRLKLSCWGHISEEAKVAAVARLAKEAREAPPVPLPVDPAPPPEVERYIASLRWSAETIDAERTLVIGNIRGFAAWLRGRSP